jgi:acetyl esterase
MLFLINRYNMKTLDPPVFLPKSIDEETGNFNESIHKLLSVMPRTYTLTPQQIRKDREAGKGLWPVTRLDEVQDRFVPGYSGEILIRIYMPEKVRGVYLHMHAGGFMIGRAHHSDIGLVSLANRCDVATCSVDYRLAPENPYPAGPDDCEAAAVWLVENAKQVFGTDVLLIGGESAGANLSVVTLLRMRDKHGVTGFSGANLLYGIYDFNLTPSARNWGETPNLILTTKLIKWFNENYVSSNHYDKPGVSPLYADLENLPSALFTVGTMDPLLDDSLFMHSRWLAAGNRSELAVYPVGIHMFNTFSIKIAGQANTRIVEFIKKTLDQANHKEFA